MRLFVLLALAAFPLLAFGADAVSPIPPVPGMDWLTAAVQTVLGIVNAIPGVGPVITAVFMVAGLVSGVMTALSICVQAVLAVPEIAARWKGAHAFADKVKALSDKILPWLRYLSMFNVPKK